MEAKIYQIFYKDEQKAHLQEDFQPYDNSGALPPHNFEYSVFIKNFISGNISEGLTGFVSWKFYQKTGIKGSEFISFIDKNPGCDVYFINPFLDHSCFRNVWSQGDYYHPDFSEITQMLLIKAGYKVDIFSFENRMDTLCYCNYWVGTKEFWGKYISFILPLFDYLENFATADELAMLNEKADKNIEAPYFPFIFERMFSTFLAINPDIKALPFEYSKRYIAEKYPEIHPRLSAMLIALKNKNSALYKYHRMALYFRMFVAKKIPFIWRFFC